jgi:phage shock protein A
MNMEHPPEDLRGMGVAEAKEYILHYITTLKLTEKKHGEKAGEHEKWLSRVRLARSRGMADLALEAQAEADKLQSERDTLAAEMAEFKAQIRRMRDQLPGLAARERSVDPDLLEQELLIALGGALGDDGKAELDRQFEAAEADSALEALKTKMKPNETP